MPIGGWAGLFFPTRGKEPKGDRGTANLSQHHGCPRIPPRLAWGRNLLLREAIGFLAGAAWNGFGCYACCLLATRRTVAAFVVRRFVGLIRAYGDKVSLLAVRSWGRGTL